MASWVSVLVPQCILVLVCGLCDAAPWSCIHTEETKWVSMKIMQVFHPSSKRGLKSLAADRRYWQTSTGLFLSSSSIRFLTLLLVLRYLLNANNTHTHTHTQYIYICTFSYWTSITAENPVKDNWEWEILTTFSWNLPSIFSKSTSKSKNHWSLNTHKNGGDLKRWVPPYIKNKSSQIHLGPLLCSVCHTTLIQKEKKDNQLLGFVSNIDTYLHQQVSCVLK